MEGCDSGHVFRMKAQIASPQAGSAARHYAATQHDVHLEYRPITLGHLPAFNVIEASIISRALDTKRRSSVTKKGARRRPFPNGSVCGFGDPPNVLELGT